MDVDVIVIAGISGCGKTTLASMLATSQSWEYIEADDYHDEAAINKMSSGTPLNDEDRLPWLQRLNDRLKQPPEESPQPANSDKTPRVLSCSALTERYRNLLADGLNVCFVWLNISRELASQRMAARPGHFMPSSLAQSQLDTAELPANALILDAAEEPEILLSKTLAYLGIS